MKQDEKFVHEPRYVITLPGIYKRQRRDRRTAWKIKTPEPMVVALPLDDLLKLRENVNKAIRRARRTELARKR